MKAKTVVVIPSYQEAENIGLLINSLYTISRQEELDIGILVVDDRSPDGTADIVSEYCVHDENIVLIERPGKGGLGSAIKEGMEKALSFPSCQFIITMDADFSHDPKDIPRLLTQAGGLVIGSRYVKNGKIKGWSPHRKFLSWGANSLCRALLRTGVRDNTTNFRLYSRMAATACLEAQGHDFEWLISVLLVAKRQGFRANEIPVVFVNRKEGASKLSVKHIARWAKFLLPKAISNLALKKN